MTNSKKKTFQKKAKPTKSPKASVKVIAKKRKKLPIDYPDGTRLEMGYCPYLGKMVQTITGPHLKEFVYAKHSDHMKAMRIRLGIDVLFSPGTLRF